MSVPVLSAFASAPAESTDARVVTALWLSYTKTSNTPFVSPATSFVAPESKATKRPSLEMDAFSPSTPTRVTAPVWRSFRKSPPLPPPRFVALDSKTTKRPSPEIWLRRELPSACAPAESTETRVSSPGAADAVPTAKKLSAINKISLKPFSVRSVDLGFIVHSFEERTIFYYLPQLVGGLRKSAANNSLC